MMSKTIIFFGNERLATGVTTTAPTLRGLIERGYTIAAIVVKQDAHKSRKIRELEVETVAKKHDIPLIKVDKMAAVVDQLKSYQPSVGVLAAFGKIVPQSIIDIFPAGIVNIHPSLLPKGRGTTPIESAILAGNKVTGVTIMSLVAAMDAGPIYGQQTLDLKGDETKQQLSDQLLKMGAGLLFEELPAIIDKSIVPSPQNEAEASYTNMIKKEDGSIDWQKTAAQLEREIRAYAEWPKSKTLLNGIEVIITKAHVENGQLSTGQIQTSSNHELLIGTSKDLLAIDSLKPTNRPEMNISAFIAGYAQALGGTEGEGGEA